jgi:hypothetical protein
MQTSPKKDLILVINNTLHNKEEQKQEILILVNAIINQNYMHHNDHQYKQDEGLAMGAPTSALPEIFIQYLEHNHIINILKSTT